MQQKRRVNRNSRRRLEDILEAKRLRADLAELDELTDHIEDYDEIINELYHRRGDD